MKLVVAALRPTPILWWRASGLESPTDVPASTLPARGIAPVRAIIASSNVVFPLGNGPTRAMHRGPRGLLTSCPIAASSFGARPLIGSAGLMLRLRRGFCKPEKFRCAVLPFNGRRRRKLRYCCYRTSLRAERGGESEPFTFLAEVP